MTAKKTSSKKTAKKKPARTIAAVRTKRVSKSTPRVSLEHIDITKRAEEELKKGRALLHLIIEGTSDAIYVKDLNGRYLLFNPAAEGITGKKSGEVLGKDDTFLFPPEEAKMVMDGDRAIMKAGTRQAYEEVVTTASGEKRTYLSTKGLLFDDSGRVAGLFGIARDITGRKKDEEELRSTHAALEQRAHELDMVNRELEAFSYAVSNDLRAPLRSIEGFTRAILEDHEATLADAAKDYFKRIASASQRMSQLIDAMLNMARLTKHDLLENVVNLTGLAEVAAHELRKKDPGRLVEFIIAQGVKAQGDTDMLRVVVENLMDNAWKFTGNREPAKIEFGVLDPGLKNPKPTIRNPQSEGLKFDMPGKTVYFVRDNGAGFNMAYANKLFMPFQRLHSDSEFPGIGIGLAMVQRIIRRHGGEIWAEGEPDKGATFYFTLHHSEKPSTIRKRTFDADKGGLNYEEP